jgi:hypothetical protein
MTHNPTSPSTTLLLIEETETEKSSRGSGKEGFISRWFNLARPRHHQREGLTAKEQEESKEIGASMLKNLNAATKKLVTEMNENSAEYYDAVASFADAATSHMLANVSLMAAQAVSSQEWAPVYKAGDEIGKLSNISSAARRLAKTGAAPAVNL